MVLVDLGKAPVGDLIGLAVPGRQGLALLVQEDLQGLGAGGAVDAHSGDVAAPALGLISGIGQILELAALEEPFPGVLDPPLDYGLVFRVTHPGGISEVAACWEDSRKPRVRWGRRASAPATAAGKLSMTRYFGMSP